MKLLRLFPIWALVALAAVLHAAAPPPPQLTSPDQVPEGLAKSDWASIREAYEAGRHAFKPTADGWQARNPGQQWLTTFDRRGFVAQPEGAAWQWGLELKSYGIDGRERAIAGVPAVKAEGQRLSYQWDAVVNEWFINDRRGLEHGFTVARRPEGQAESPLAFTLGVRGGLRPALSTDGLGVSFQNDSGATVLNYTGLKVTDADGRALASHFVAAGPGVRMLVEAGGARYPITIDPIAQQAYLKASNTGAGDAFGYAVAVSGDTVVVGAIGEASNATGVNGSQADDSAFNSGAAYVFVRNGTTWTQQAYLKASNTGGSDRFGYAVAVSGDTVVVGAYKENNNATGVNGNQSNGTASQSGAAYVFVRTGTTWSQQAYLKASNTQAGDSFGYAVAVSGDTIVAGAYLESSNATGVNGNQNDNSTPSSGAAYVFSRSGTTWSQQAYLKASNTEANDRFGYAVAVSGDSLVVGAYGEGSNATGVNGTQSNNSAAGSGAAYVFTRGGTTWTQQAYLKASNTEGGDNFGSSVGVSGDTVVVGAPHESSNATGVNGTQTNNLAPSSGAAYVFTRSGTTWSQQAYLKASNAEANDYFGAALAVSGDTVVLGVASESSNATGVNGTQSDNTAVGSGAAYVFARSGTTWSQQAYVKASNTGAGDNFAIAVGVSGNTVVAGAHNEASNATGVDGSQSDNSAGGAGAAYVFTLPSVVPTVTGVSPASGSTAGGTSVTLTGTSFSTTTGVTFGGNPATGVTVVNGTTITCVTPPGAVGPASVVVTNSGGSNVGNTLFTYFVPPTPDIAVAQAGPLTDGVGTRTFGLATAATGSPLTFTITNAGDGPLTSLAVTKDGADAADFTVGALSGTSIPVGTGTVTFTVTFAPATGGVKAAAIHIASNVGGAKNPFDITLTGQGLSPALDTDGDGLNDAAEFNLAALGFNWQVGQAALVNTLFNNASSAGLYTTSQVQALNIDVPLLTKQAGTGQFKLTIGVQKSTTLNPGSFQPLPMSAGQTLINGSGQLEFLFSSPETPAFYRLETK